MNEHKNHKFFYEKIWNFKFHYRSFISTDKNRCDETKLVQLKDV